MQLNLDEYVGDMDDVCTDQSMQIENNFYIRCFRSALAISPDNRFVALDRYNLVVWDLWNLTPDISPNYVWTGYDLINIVFEDNLTVRSQRDPLRGVNVITGEWVDYVEERAIRTTTPVEGESDKDIRRYWEQTDCGTLHVEYDMNTRQLVLIDEETRRVLEANLNLTRPRFSPDCNIVFGYVSIVSNADVPYDDAPFDDRRRDRGSKTIVFWDATTGVRLATFDYHPHAYRYSTIRWSRDSSRVFVGTSEDHYIWHPVSGQIVTLQHMIEPQRSRIFNYWFTIRWDFPRGQLLISGWNAVHAFDITTGIERFRFGTCDSYWGCSFTVEGNILMVAG